MFLSLKWKPLQYLFMILCYKKGVAYLALSKNYCFLLIYFF